MVGRRALRVHDLPEPHPGAKEVRIHVRAVAVSPTDLGLRNGGYDTTNAEPPYIPGMDAAGMIDEVGNYLIQLAKKRGLVVVADAAPKDVALVQSLGADHIVDRGDDVADRIRAIFPNGVDAVADSRSVTRFADPLVAKDRLRSRAH